MFIKILSSLIFLITSLDCNTKVGNEAIQNPVITEVSVNQAKSLINKTKGLIILDVRTPEETAQGIIQGAIIIDIARNDFKTKVQKLDKSKPILVYCKGGGRSSTATEIMEELGFKKLYNLTDGYDEWKKKY